MKFAFDHLGVSDKQIKSGVFDGVYNHVSFYKHLGNLHPDMTEADFMFVWDLLHRTGLGDKHVCKDNGR